MKKINLSVLVAFIAIFALSLSSCSKDDMDLLEGTWNGSSTSLDSYTVNGKDFVTFYVEAGGTEEEANTYYSMFEVMITEFTPKSVTFHSEGSYTMTDSDGAASNGTYTLEDDVLTLVEDGETMKATVKTLTDSSLEIQFEESDTDDMDGDGTDDTTKMMFTMKFTK